MTENAFLVELFTLSRQHFQTLWIMWIAVMAALTAFAFSERYQNTRGLVHGVVATAFFIFAVVNIFNLHEVSRFHDEVLSMIKTRKEPLLAPFLKMGPTNFGVVVSIHVLFDVALLVCLLAGRKVFRASNAKN